MKIKKSEIKYFTFFMYLCVLTTHQSNSNLDDFLKITSFLVFVFITFITSIKDRKIKITGMTKWYSLFFIFAMMSCLWAKYSFEGVFMYSKAMFQILLITLCIPLIIKNKEDLYKVLKLVMYSLLYSALTVIIKTPISQWGSSRMGVSIGLEPNTLGMQMAFGMLISLIIYLKNHKKINLLYILIFVILALFSGSKKALIILVLGVIFLFFNSTNFKNIKQGFSRVLIIIIALVGGIYFIFNNQALYNVLGTRLERTINYFKTDGQAFDNSSRERDYYIRVAKNLFKESPIIGVGLNNFQYYIKKIGYYHVAYSHNNYWELLSGLGIIGTMILYSFYLYLLICNIKLLNKNKEYLTGLLHALLLLFIICDYANVSYISMFQYVLLAIIYANIYISKREERDDEKK